MTQHSDNEKNHFPNRTLSVKRNREGWLAVFFGGSSTRGDDESRALAGVSAMPLKKVLLISIAIHVAVIGLTSIGFVIRCVEKGTLFPAAAEKAESEKQKANAADKNARPRTRPASTAPAQDRRGDSEIEKLLKETSSERPEESDVTLDLME